jgi:hypothetical protein
LDYCSALHYRGKLADVPGILRAYERIAEFPDSDIVPVWLSNLLEPEDGVVSVQVRPDDLPDYLKTVSDRYNELAAELGTDQVIVFRGARFGVVPLAQYVLRRIQHPYVRDELRHRFEASTGIDCTGFYRNGDLRPLAAAVILEDFLASPAADAFEPGVRYFFGHRIPD